MVLGATPLLSSCLGGGDGPAPAPSGKEPRTYYFHLENAQQGAEYFLVSGHRHHAIVPAQPHHVAAAMATDSRLTPSQITHVAADVPLSAASLQACYVKGVHGPGLTEWHMHSMFTHRPSTSARARCAVPAQCTASNAIGATAEATPTALSCGPSSVATYMQQAADMIMHHPEIGNWDPVQYDYIWNTYVCPHPRTLALARGIYTQGVATTAGGWATLVPATDGNGQPILDPNGQQACYTNYSALTTQLLGLAIHDILPLIKNDTSLGVNVTGLSGDAFVSAVQGKVWTVRNAVPSSTAPLALTAVARAASATLQGANLAALPATFGMTVSNVSGGKGYRLEDDNLVVSDDRTVTFTVDNGFARYLGVYVRFLDGAGNPIALSSLDSTTLAQFPLTKLNGTYDGFLGICNQVPIYFGFPKWWSPTTRTYTVQLPPGAASVMVLSGGLGIGSQDYPETVQPGMVITAVLNLALPGLFLSMGACQAYSSFAADVGAVVGLLSGLAQVLILAIADAGLSGSYQDPKLFMNVIPPLVVTIVKQLNVGGALGEFVSKLWESVAEGEAIAAAEAATPFGIGLILQAVSALATAVQIAQTSAEVATSPWTYADTLVLTHSTTVTFYPDPRDTAGFPAVGTTYQVAAICDGASPRLSPLLAMPSTTTTGPLSYTFDKLPYGGKVTFIVKIMSSTGWVAGAGTTGAIDNTGDSASITITENLVPLDETTQYSHREIIVLSNGRRAWSAGAKPPAPPTGCGNTPGSLCQLVGITVSEPYAAIGYAWQASSNGVSAFGGGGGQLYQFANISFTGDPQSGYMFSGSGFPSPARIAYSRDNASSYAVYLDTTGQQPVVRRIRLTGIGQAPTFDGPSSNLALGRLNFPSDALLVHTNGSIISLNSALSKIEVLKPAQDAMPDALAPLANAVSGPGTRDGLISGPVLAAMGLDGAIYVVEQNNNRVQAFDTAGSPHAIFQNGSTFALKDHGVAVTYLDIAVEAAGFVYMLVQSSTGVIMLDIYDKTGKWLSTTNDMRAGKIGLDLWRNAYALNYQPISGVNYVEPSVSQWIPSTP